MLRRGWPFLAATAVAFALLPVSAMGSIDPVDVAVAAAVMVAIVLAVAFVPWERLPRTLTVFPPLAYFVLVALLRDASGGAASGYAALVLLPVLWAALYGERADTIATLFGVWATFVIPIIVDQSRYPPSDWRFAVLLTLLAAFIGFATQGLVENVRLRAREAARSAQRMRRSEEYLRAVMTSAAEGIVTLTPAGRGSFVNPSAARMLGYQAAELHGRDLSDLIVEGGLRPGDADTAGDGVFRRKDGSTFPVIYNNTPIRLEGGGSGGTIVSFLDITERSQIERMKDEFVSVVGHELRTPLTSIRGSLGLMAGGLFGELDDQGRRMLDIAISNTDRLVRLINDTLDIERIESGRVTLQQVPCRTDELVAQAVEAMRGQADTVGVGLVDDADAVLLRADPDRVLQTLTNLISNALKFSPRGEAVRVTAHALADMALFSVADRGRGVPDDMREAIFERFGQVDASDSREKGGTGLGLPIARSIVEQHGGRIWVDSRVGRGSTFWFTLPRSSEAVEGADDAGAGPRSAALVVEDDADLARVLRAMLERHGVDTVVTPSAEEAIDLVDAHTPSLLVLDIELIGAKGGTVVDHLREHPEIPPIPVVVYTVHDLSEHDRERLTLGKTLFFTKGRVAPEEFERRVTDLLEEVRPRA
ncbi:MAG TPA: ATP-binding protein [Solirubrobacteraceae bacterium]|nr:ATP-binding protein [Solirubrobacteraceae bacterium]